MPQEKVLVFWDYTICVLFPRHANWFTLSRLSHVQYSTSICRPTGHLLWILFKDRSTLWQSNWLTAPKLVSRPPSHTRIGFSVISKLYFASDQLVSGHRSHGRHYRRSKSLVCSLVQGYGLWLPRAASFWGQTEKNSRPSSLSRHASLLTN